MRKPERERQRGRLCEVASRTESNLHSLFDLPQRVTYPSRALREVSFFKRPNQQAASARILDLGPAVGSNVDRYSTIASKIHIEDLCESISALRGSSDIPNWEELLPRRKGGDFDLVLCWDLFNYLSSAHVRSFGNYLSSLCRPGALIFSVIYSNEQIPAMPSRFAIDTASFDLTITQTTSSRIPGPRYQQSVLLRLLPDFHLSFSCLVRFGFREELFVCRPTVGSE